MIYQFGKSPSTTLSVLKVRSLKHHICASQTIQTQLGTLFSVFHALISSLDTHTHKALCGLIFLLSFVLKRYRNLEACITALPEVSSSDDDAGGAIEKWPERAFTLPPRISSGSIPGITAERFKEDNELWKERVAHYKRIISPLPTGRYRNIMDMNAYLGGFAAAVSKYPVWVMNVVPANSDHNTLGVIYERGFIGTYQDWCEAFSTYPRTYDLIHASGLFSIYQDR